MRSFWLFATNAGDGTEGNPNRPALPAVVGGKWTSPGDVVRLIGPVASPHRHLLVGGIALADDNLDGLPGDGHVHYVIGDAQVTVDATPHTHIVNVQVPDYYLLFWFGSDADAATIAADPNCFPVVEATVTEDDGNYSIGALKAGWATQDTAWWHAKVLDMLGVQLPVEVTNGRRLVRLFLGALLSRQTENEAGYRLRS